MKIKNSEFLISVANKDNILDTGLKEFVFVGRSNCGKSSLINSLVNKKNLAKTSSTPGLTKLINYFLINNTNKTKIIEKIKGNEKISDESGFLLVDLPGYGYSIAGKTHHELWSDLIDNYFKTSKNIKKVFVLVDIRRDPSNLDKQMIQYLYFIEFHLLL
jgi:GTP-binding protein